MNNQSLCKEWLDFAQMDYASANHLLSLHPRPLEIICFHCQQAVEKAFKGVLVAQNIEPPKTHDIVELCVMCAKADGSFHQLLSISQRLKPYGVQARYPSNIELEESDAAAALSGAKTALDFIQQFLQTKTGSGDPNMDVPTR